MRIVLVDGDYATHEQFRNILPSFRIKTYNCGSSFLESLSEHIYDVVFLDVHLPRHSGYDVGQLIRSCLRNANSSIIYLTEKTDISLKLLSIKPVDFLLKPVNRKKLIHLINLLRNEETTPTLDIQQGHERFRVAENDVICLESRGPLVKIHTRHGSYRMYCKLSDFPTDYPFVRVHQSFIINLAFIASITKDRLILQDGRTVPVSRRYRSNLAGLYG